MRELRWLECVSVAGVAQERGRPSEFERARWRVDMALLRRELQSLEERRWRSAQPLGIAMGHDGHFI